MSALQESVDRLILLLVRVDHFGISNSVIHAFNTACRKIDLTSV